jgi:hypothetical protein
LYRDGFRVGDKYFLPFGIEKRNANQKRKVMAEEKEHNSHDIHVIADRVNELYNAILGPKLMRNIGIMNRLETTEKNVGFLSQKLADMEDMIKKEFNAIKLDNAKSNIRLNILWTSVGIVSGTGLTLILEFILKK